MLAATFAELKVFSEFASMWELELDPPVESERGQQPRGSSNNHQRVVGNVDTIPVRHGKLEREQRSEEDSIPNAECGGIGSR